MNNRSILIVAVSEEIRANLSEALAKAGFNDISISSGANVRELLREKQYYIVMLVLPLENEFGLELASHISRCSDSPVVILSPAKVFDDVCEKVADMGFYILPKASPRGLIVSTVRSAAVHRSRLDELKTENKTLNDMVSEMKLVNRAKCVLVEYLRISEKEAHRQIQKRAMDQRITLTEAAADILKTYEYR